MPITMQEYPNVNVDALLAKISRLETLVEQMSIDTVTGIPNRGALEMELGVRQSRQMRGEAFAVMFIDIDHFKKVNDSRGHAEGDTVLRGVAATIQASIRPHDYVGRFGGEEFVVVTDSAGADKMADRILASVEALTGVTVSIGVCFWTTPHVALKSVLNRADAALYDAKKCGRNNVQYANEENPSHA